MSDAERDELLRQLTNTVTVLAMATRNGHNSVLGALGSALHSLAKASEPLGDAGVTKQTKDFAGIIAKQG